MIVKDGTPLDVIKDQYPDDYRDLLKVEHIIDQYLIFRDMHECNLSVNARDISYHDFNCFRLIEGTIRKWQKT